MKRFYSRFRIALMTFTLSLGFVWFFNFFQLPLASHEVDEFNLRNAIVVTTVPRNTAESLKFMPTGRYCGMGYTQEYMTRDDRSMSEGATRLSRNEFNRKLKGAQIIEKIENSKNRFDEEGLRVIAKILSKKGEESFEILWYGKGRLHYISAPTLDLALEFEKLNAYAY